MLRLPALLALAAAVGVAGLRAAPSAGARSDAGSVDGHLPNGASADTGSPTDAPPNGTSPNAIRPAFPRRPAPPDAPSPRIRLNQVGFPTHGAKRAIVVLDEGTDAGAADVAGREAAPTPFAVLDARGDTAFRGVLGPVARWAPSGERVREARFDALARPGRYVLDVPGVGRSAPVVVSDTPYRALAVGALRGFWFQRVSEPLPAALAGPWARPAGHADRYVRVHPSAAGPGRPAGHVIASPGGWYDAGDYNKYVVNSGITTWTLLALAEQWPAWSARHPLGIPESGDALPDVLDEALVNVRWMRTMQDPADGGVYHKLTNARFDGFVMPHVAGAGREPRWVVQKSTAAALDLAAVLAQAARVVRAHPRALPGLADSLQREALAAWRWACLHPDSLYDQQRLNAATDPDIETGEYGDRTLDDERRWAAAELWATTRADSFLVAALPAAPAAGASGPAAPPPDVPTWNAVGTLGLYTLVEHRRALPARVDTAALVGRLRTLGDTLVARARRSAYGVPMEADDFVWGSSAVAANQGMALVQLWRATGDTAALRVAHATLDYLTGRNATGHSFVTGFGTFTPRRPHHRPSAADTVDAPVPGLLVGGPNPARQDRCPGYPSALPARAWVDSTCSYASNEIAINWNAPLAYLAAALDAIHAIAANGGEASHAGAAREARPGRAPAERRARDRRAVPGQRPR